MLDNPDANFPSRFVVGIEGRKLRCCYRCDPYLFFFLGCPRIKIVSTRPSVTWTGKRFPFWLNTTCVRNSITGSVCGFLPLSLFIVRWQRERERRRVPLFSSFVVFQRTAGLLVVKERERELSLSLRDGIYETEGKRFCCKEKSRFFIPFLFVVLVVVVFAQISKLKKFRSLNANRSRHIQQLVCISLSSFRMGSNYINDYKFFFLFFSF